MREVPDGKTAHGLYLKRLQEAFESHRADFGWEGRELYFEGEDMPKPPKDSMHEYISLPTSKL